jgi:hypothetical protein
MHKIVATQQALACIVFGKICLYEGNGFVLFEDVGLISTLKSILQEHLVLGHSYPRHFVSYRAKIFVSSFFGGVF